MSCIEVMPKLGLTMKEGTIEAWHKKEGEEVKKGEVIFDVTTDKLTNEIEAKESGVLRKILVHEGETVECRVPVAIIAGKDEDISNMLKEVGVAGKEEIAEGKVDNQPLNKTKEKVISKNKNIAIIGGGPGGYIAAIRGAQLGNNVTLIEKEELGGTCLNVGCMPTKTLLHSADLFTEIKNSRSLGIDVSEANINWDNVQKRKKRVVKKLVAGVKGLLSFNKVKIIKGFAKFESKNSLIVTKEDNKTEKIDFDDAIIASGSVSFMPQIPGIDLDGIIDSTGALNLKSIPETIAIIGGGIIAIEFASLFSALGTKVTILDEESFILPTVDRQIADLIGNKLSKQGAEINTGCKVTKIEKSEKGLKVYFTRKNENLNVEAEKVLVTVKRCPNTEGLNIEGIGINTSNGSICVDDEMKTNVGNIYAIGDCTGKNMFAHAASAEGVVAAENISGQGVKMAYKTVPTCVYTKPEIAAVGLTEDEVKEKGIKYKVGVFPMGANGRAMIFNEQDGIIKIISDEKYGEILGVHILAPRATDLIAEGALALRLEATVDEIITTVHAHPTIGEAFKEAALAVYNRALNNVNEK